MKEVAKRKRTLDSIGQVTRKPMAARKDGHFDPWCNGSTADFGSAGPGSNPGGSTTQHQPTMKIYESKRGDRAHRMAKDSRQDEGYRIKDEIVELRDGAHRVCDLELVQVQPLFPDDPLRNKLRSTGYFELVAKDLARKIGEKLLTDGIMKVITGQNFVSVTMKNILLPDPYTERFVKNNFADPE